MGDNNITVKRYSEEWRKKVSSGWFQKGITSRNKGVPMSEEAKRKLSEARKGKIAWNKGKKMPEEQRKKMIGILKGVRRSPKTEFKKGEFEGNKNPAKRIDIREKISKAKRGKPHFNQRQENHPRWKGDIAQENERIRRRIEYKLWREAVFSRDGWICKKCKKKGGALNVHHIYNFADFSELQISINNGITLCRKCHKEFHGLYGVRNNTEEKFKEFLTI